MAHLVPYQTLCFARLARRHALVADDLRGLGFKVMYLGSLLRSVERNLAEINADCDNAQSAIEAFRRFKTECQAAMELSDIDEMTCRRDRLISRRAAITVRSSAPECRLVPGACAHTP